LVVDSGTAVGLGATGFNGGRFKLAVSGPVEGLSEIRCELDVGGTAEGLGAPWFNGGFCEASLGIAVAPIPEGLGSWDFG
jgi:hypothetical protein